MKKSSPLLHAAVTSLMAMGAAAVLNTAAAADKDMEQCAGVIKAGKNDCATDANACHGHVESDATPMAWIYLPKGTCAKIAGARVVQVVDPTAKAKS